MITRREVIRAAFLGTGATLMARAVADQTPNGPPASPLGIRLVTPIGPLPPEAAPPTGPFILPPLPYDAKALEPYIDTQTMQIHHDKHHQAYVTNLNKAVAKYSDLQKKSIAELVAGIDTVPEDIRTAVRNNGGGHYNHSLFWAMMRPGPNMSALGLPLPNAPTGALLTALHGKFGSVTNFQQQFTDAAIKQFGSGWAWLSLDRKAGLVVESTPNQDSPLMFGRKPLLGIDVWEHAYYLKYQNRRPEYIAAWFNVVNWDFAAHRFQQGTSRS